MKRTMLTLATLCFGLCSFASQSKLLIARGVGLVPTASTLEADLNGDGIVNLAILANEWLQPDGGIEEGLKATIDWYMASREGM
ncbi:hypothetical protein ES703_77400 [subsurface metagenome]